LNISPAKIQLLRKHPAIRDLEYLRDAAPDRIFLTFLENKDQKELINFFYRTIGVEKPTRGGARTRRMRRRLGKPKTKRNIYKSNGKTKRSKKRISRKNK
jgi:hypothetical protein